MDDQDEAEGIAQKVLMRHGYVTQCEYHEERYDAGAGYPEGDAGMLLTMTAEMRAEGWTGDNDEAAKLLQDGVAQLGLDCSWCTKHQAD